jgi:tetratricopeptide (TPR) repeat protein
MPRRRYNLISCAVICGIGALIVAVGSSGYGFRAIGYVLSLLPEGDLGVLVHPTKDEFVEVSITLDGEEVLLAKRGDYQIFVPEGSRSPEELALALVETGEQIELVPLPSDLSVYGPDLVDKVPVFAFHIDEPGAYEIRTVDQGRSYSLIIVPHYIAKNRIRLLACLSLPLAVLIIAGMIKYLPSIRESREHKRERTDDKRKRWDKLTQEFQPKDIDELLPGLEQEYGTEESLPPEVEELLHVLQSDGQYTARRDAAEKLGRVDTSSARVVRALVAAYESDPYAAVNRAAAESLRAPVHQTYLQQYPDMAEGTGQAILQLPGSERSPGRDEKARPPAETEAKMLHAKMQEGVRSWALWSLGIGLLSLVISGLSAPWGVMLLVVALASFVFRETPMFVVYGVILAWAGITNALSGEAGWIALGALQLVFACLALRQYARFRRAEKTLESPLGPERARHAFPEIGCALGALALVGLLVVPIVDTVLSPSGTIGAQDPWAWAADLAVGLAVLGLAACVASLLSGYRNRVFAVLGTASSGLVLLLVVGLDALDAVPPSDQPTEAAVHYEQALVLTNEGRTEEAIAEYKEAIRLSPNYALAHNDLGVEYYQIGLLVEAEAEFEKAIGCDPTLAIAHANLANVYGDQCRCDEGLTSVKEALRLDPSLAYAHLVSGYLHSSLGRLGEAQSALEEAIELDSSLLYAYAKLGMVHIEQENWNLAIECLNDALEREMADDLKSVLYSWRGFSHGALSEYDDALADLDQAVVMDDNNAFAYHVRGAVCAEIGERQRAISDLERALQLGLSPDLEHEAEAILAELGR